LFEAFGRRRRSFAPRPFGARFRLALASEALGVTRQSFGLILHACGMEIGDRRPEVSHAPLRFSLLRAAPRLGSPFLEASREGAGHIFETPHVLSIPRRLRSFHGFADFGQFAPHGAQITFPTWPLATCRLAESLFDSLQVGSQLASFLVLVRLQRGEFTADSVSLPIQIPSFFFADPWWSLSPLAFPSFSCRTLPAPQFTLNSFQSSFEFTRFRVLLGLQALESCANFSRLCFQFSARFGVSFCRRRRVPPLTFTTLSHFSSRSFSFCSRCKP
jgi:hypothetical protein